MENWKRNADHERFVASESWDGSKLSFEKADSKDYGFLWPQRNYKCSFCKKEFKSAQALGGHMNVHRRDRARLRLSSPSSLTDSPNPNPINTTLSPSATKVFPYHKTAACNDHSSLSCVSNASFAEKGLHLGPFTRDGKASRKVDFPKARDAMEICGSDRGKKKKGAMAMHEFASRKDGRMLKANRLDLNKGFVGESKAAQDLDLELRLGYC